MAMHPTGTRLPSGVDLLRRHPRSFCSTWRQPSRSVERNAVWWRTTRENTADRGCGFDVPQDYIHQIGRAARGARPGWAITFLNSEAQSQFPSLMKVVHQSAPDRVSPLPHQLRQLEEYALRRGVQTCLGRRSLTPSRADAGLQAPFPGGCAA